MIDNLQESLLSLFEYNPDPCYILDLRGKFIAFNDATLKLTGYSKEELLAMTFHPLIVPEQLEDVRRTFHTIVTIGMKADFEVMLYAKSGELLHLSVTAMPVNIGGETTGVIGMVKNLTKSKRLEQSLLNTQTQLKNIFDSVKVCLWSRHLVTEETQVSPACEVIYGFSQQQFVDNPYLWKQVIYPDDLPDVEKRQRSMACGEALSHEYRIVRADGEVRWVHDYTVPVLNQAGAVVRLDGVISDISVRKKTEERLYTLAYHDALTGLPNRRFIRERIRTVIGQAERKRTKVFILYLDLDGFKSINDSLGHSGGDRLLQRVSKRITRCLRQGDPIARIGGDEFAIILEEATETDVELIADRILEAVAKPFRMTHQEFIVTTSIGISVYPEHGDHHEPLFKRADQAMYFAKEKGKNQIQWFNQEISDKVERRLMLEQGLRKALLQEEFVLYYQPIVNVVTKRIVGTEALIRWKHAAGLISPLEFIQIAEELGHIVQIGEWVLRTACIQNKMWQGLARESLFVSVNLSVRQLEQDGFVESLQAILEETELDPRYLHVEITESAAIKNIHQALTVLQTLSSLGVSISIDDFGTGYSSLSYLEKLPIHTLKIDQMFIRSNQMAIIKAIIAMANSLNLCVIAEGVETKEQLRRIRDIGCSDMQGYWFSEPVQPQIIESFLLDTDLWSRFLEKA
ncbi:sensor domain-containing protein [Paenibacillus rigui]|nr:GGDEF and EAL domain-containing protein [Paenibacillus rigui]